MRPWPLFKVTEVQESKHFCAIYLTKISNNLDGNWHTVETCWSEEPQTLFMLSNLFLAERTLVKRFSSKDNIIGLHSNLACWNAEKEKEGEEGMVDKTKLCNLIRVWITFAHIHGHFLPKFSIDLDEI